LSRNEFMQILTTHQMVLAGQSNDLAPADGKLYALRDVTGTVESIPLIASSIMSKKLAIGASHLLLDVKFGTGAFMKTIDRARALATAMVEIGRAGGMHTVATITSMEQPLGYAVGNALELAEAIAILRGAGPPDVSYLCQHEAAELLLMTGRASTTPEAETLVTHAIQTGTAVAKLADVVAAQGGDARQIEQPQLLPHAPVRSMLAAPRNGYLAGINAEQIGLVSMHLGAGRFKKGEQIDHSTGLILQAKIGAYLHAGDPLVEIHARTADEAEAIRESLLACYTWSDTSVHVDPLIADIIHP
jgi:pyrimidine-nucleoside phosphorylase